ncbi:5-hydroxytryptamine receptor 1B-like [Paramacrobiotus metropolitanus]|uniref:5-hydroxytryptamine receptor 1B-like n=1 Tax=Paramacrobiotus metropolitanus TaxID=2943436 RepID=UPI002445F791|nr:5-hydroxytryptamine receptor 1B-like [Paramacrobiotus metropolitanus]
MQNASSNFTFANISSFKSHQDSNTSTNDTADFDYGTIASSATLMLFSLLTNGFVLIMYAMHHELRSPFSFYVMNLFINNLYLAIADPLRIIDTLSTKWFPKTAACRFFIINDYIGCAMVNHAHLLITLNRAWAIMFPISYKQLHTRTMAKCICIGSAVYCHIILLPFIIIDFMYYRGPDLNADSCDVKTGAQKAYTQFLLKVFFQVPMFVILGTYPLLYWKRLTARKVAGRNHGNESTMQGTFSVIAEKVTTDLRQAVTVRHKDGSRKPFYVLTAMTLGVLVCWTPVKVYNFVQAVAGDDYVNTPSFKELRTIGNVVYELECIIDPILFTLVLSDLRAVIIRLFKQMFCKQ